MQAVVEITMYPFAETFTPPIDRFLEALNSTSDIEVKTNRMSTQLYGDYDAVMALVTEAIKTSRERDGSAAFVFKVLPGAQRTINGYE